jgi:hypothetical protein
VVLLGMNRPLHPDDGVMGPVLGVWSRSRAPASQAAPGMPLQQHPQQQRQEEEEDEEKEP